MPDRDDKVAADRRNFLKLAGVGTLTGGAALALSRSQVDASEAPSSGGKSYRETDHVRTFYDTARF